MFTVATPRIQNTPYITTALFDTDSIDRPTVDSAKQNALHTAPTDNFLSHTQPTKGPISTATRDRADVTAVACAGVNPATTIVGIPCWSIALEATTARQHDMSTNHVTGFLIAMLNSTPCSTVGRAAALSATSGSPIRFIPLSSGLHLTNLITNNSAMTMKTATIIYPALQLNLPMTAVSTFSSSMNISCIPARNMLMALPFAFSPNQLDTSS